MGQSPFKVPFKMFNKQSKKIFKIVGMQRNKKMRTIFEKKINKQEKLTQDNPDVEFSRQY